MKYIPFNKINIPDSILKDLKNVIKSGWITTGIQTCKLENKISSIIGAKNVIAVSSGTAALHLAYLAAGIGYGDEVIVPSFTFCSTVNSIIHTGARPVFCDILENTMCIDPSDIEKRITKKTKAIVAVHFAGRVAEMNSINRIARKYNLVVIEDAAHAFLARYNNKYIGSGKNITCLSFYATKNLTTAEGGAILCNNVKIARYIRSLSMHGITKQAWNRYKKDGSWKYGVKYAGYKYNLSDVHATIGLSQLPNIYKAHAYREKLVKLYKELLKENKNIILPTDTSKFGSEHAWHLFVIRIKPTSKINRDDLIERLRAVGIGTSVHFIPNHMQEFYRKLGAFNTKLPITEKIGREILSLPLYERLKKSEIRYICKKINEATNE